MSGCEATSGVDEVTVTWCHEEVETEYDSAMASAECDEENGVAERGIDDDGVEGIET